MDSSCNRQRPQGKKSFADEEDENLGDDDALDDHDGISNVVNDVDHNHEDKYDEN